jgi:hypothetical protein
MDKLRGAISAFIEERYWEQVHSPKNLVMALSVEVAEVVNPELLQWRPCFRAQPSTLVRPSSRRSAAPPSRRRERSPARCRS